MKKKKSNFEVMTNKLNEESLIHKKSGNRIEVQKNNLNKMWLRTLKEAQSSTELKLLLDTNKINNFTISELSTPNNLDLKNHIHFNFVMNILRELGRFFATNASASYRSSLILPLPKKYIKKAIFYWNDYMKQDEKLFSIEDEDRFGFNINYQLGTLEGKFIDTVDENFLPEEIMENFKIGAELSDKQMENVDQENIELVDWLNEDDWLAKGILYAENDQIELAKICYKRALTLNSSNLETYHLLGSAFQHSNDYGQAIKYYDLGLEIENNNID